MKIICTLWPETKVSKKRKRKKNWWHAGQDIYTEKCAIIKFSVREIAEEISQEVHVHGLEDWVIPQSNSS